MQAAMEKTRAQLEFWRARIDHLAARTQLSGGEPSFDALVHIDELKALHALAQAQFDALLTGAAEERARRERELKRSMADLAVAIKDPAARRRR